MKIRKRSIVYPLLFLGVGWLLGAGFRGSSGGAATGSGVGEEAGASFSPQAANAVTDGAGEGDAGVETLEALLESVANSESFEQRFALMQWVVEVPLEEIPEVLMQLHEKDWNAADARWGMELGHLLFRRLVENDVQAAWELAQAIGFERRAGRQTIAQGIFSMIPEGWHEVFLEQLMKPGLVDRETLPSTLSQLLGSMMRFDPERAFQLAVYYREAGVLQPWHVSNTVTAWRSRDPGAALAAVAALSSERDRAVVLQNWSWNHPNAESAVEFLTWLDALPGDPTSVSARRNSLSRLFQLDHRAAIRYLDSIEDPARRLRILEGVQLNNLSTADGRASFDALNEWTANTFRGQAYDRQIGQLYRALAGTDAEQAFSLALELPIGGARENALGGVLQHMAQSDPKQALEWLVGMEDPADRQAVMRNISWQVTNHGIETVLEFLAENDAPEVMEALSQPLARKLAEYDLPHALALIEAGHFKGNARNQAVQSVAANWAKWDLDGALGYLRENLEPGQMASAMSDVAQELANWDPELAVQSLERLGELAPDAGGQLHSRVAQAWVRHDPMAASQWISDLPSGAARDNAVTVLVRAINQQDPEAAFAWAMTLESERQRPNLVTQTVREWVKTDKEGARVAVEAADLSEAEMRRVELMLRD